MLLYEAPNIIKISYEKENELIIHDWLEYNPDGSDQIIIMVMEEMYDILLKYPVNKLMVKADQTKGIFSPNIQNYIRDVQIPRVLANTKLRYVVTINSELTMKRIGALVWQKQFHDDDEIVLQDMGSEEEAREWLKSLPNNTFK